MTESQQELNIGQNRFTEVGQSGIAQAFLFRTPAAHLSAKYCSRYLTENKNVNSKSI